MPVVVDFVVVVSDIVVVVVIVVNVVVVALLVVTYHITFRFHSEAPKGFFLLLYVNLLLWPSGSLLHLF